MNPSGHQSSLSPADIRAAAETHQELGPEYRDAVLESFLQQVGKEIDARVDTRVAAIKDQKPARPPSPALAITSMAIGVPLTAIALAFPKGDQLRTVLIIWIAIVLVNVAHAVASRPRSTDR
jgi:hypothetical protein